MKNSIIALLAVVAMSLSASSSAFAALLSTSAGSKNIEGVQIASEGSVVIDNQKIPVVIVGAGLRAKKVALFKVKVYVAELLSSDASKFVRNETNALASLDQSRTVAIRLNFVREVDAPTVQTSFADALKANRIAVDQGAVAQFLNAVAQGGDAVSGKSLTIVTVKNADKTETAFYEDAKGQVTKVTGGEGFSRQLMSIWLGNPSDDGVAALKQQLIQGL